MDLLNANNRRENELSGMSDQDEWFEHKKVNTRDPYNTRSTNHRHHHSGSAGHLETT